MKVLFSILTLLGLTGFPVAASSDGQLAKELRHNPFAKPALLALPSTKEVTKTTPPIKPAVELELTATLVSDVMPLIIVGGELLGIGEAIEGYRLIAVQEGVAVFDREGQRHTVSLVESGVEVQ